MLCCNEGLFAAVPASDDDDDDEHFISLHVRNVLIIDRQFFDFRDFNDSPFFFFCISLIFGMSLTDR